MKEKKATEMSVAEFEQWLKTRKAQLFDASTDRCDSNIWRSSMIGRQAAQKGGMPPVVAMHTRRAMQRRRG